MTEQDAVFAVLDNRGVVALGGEERSAFLQGLVTNDLRKLAANRALYSLLLTAQGKFLHDFILTDAGDAILAETEGDRTDEMIRRLKPYKLRSKVTFANATATYRVLALFGTAALAKLGLTAEPGDAKPFAGGVAFTDPRLPGLGARAVVPVDGGWEAAVAQAGFAPVEPGAYDAHRLALGVPDGSRDMPVERTIPLEANMDALNAIAWDKGCYMGQELTARTRYRALIKKRLFPVTVDGPLPGSGTPLTLDGVDAGEMRGGAGTQAIALIRLELLAQAEDGGRAFAAGDSVVRPHRPQWLTAPSPEQGTP
ncbi:folate-binding protein YgfZ [Azospirillum fermentarium]|uniref:CAF17-like 4Fe-4S cluster assembly/insertion protein YgfZ n=1 Tax=Azospirillum fermentarium TaxID=1233114 RepID=UPI0022271043|nr:folate-binding protein [Azospirillum fermentarium]MCW2246787.1 folate-binding protein YgfZ [Azospirillum fermentarium]